MADCWHYSDHHAGTRTGNSYNTRAVQVVRSPLWRKSNITHKLKTENCQRWDQSLKCFLADHIQLLTPPPHEPASSPVVVSVAECPDRDGEGLPHGVQVVLDHLGLVADSKPGDTWETSSWFMWRDVNVASRRNLLAHVRQNKLVPCTSLMGLLGDEHWAKLEASRAISNHKNNKRFLCWQISN